MRITSWLKGIAAAAALVVLSAIPASASLTSSTYATHSTPLSECFAAFSYPEHSTHILGMTTKITYELTGDIVYYWSDNRNGGTDAHPTYGGGNVSNAMGHAWDGHQWTVAAYTESLVTHNNSVSCEGDMWDSGDGGATWNFIGFTWLWAPITRTVAATRYDFVGFVPVGSTDNIAWCDTVNYYIVEAGKFTHTAGNGWMQQGPWYGHTQPPVAVNSQAIAVSNARLLPATANTCGSTVPGLYFTQYVWRTYFFAWNTENAWDAWNDGTWFDEHQ